MPSVEVSADKRGFILAPGGQPFVPWGFNYDHDQRGRLIEDYWQDEWPKIEADFAEMKRLGANVVRVHLQFGRFMETADKPNAAALDRLAKLVALAERQRLYLDLTGLGCYHKKDVPEWYDKLDEHDRWAAQACFWKAIAERVGKSPAIFCYDLMNEPVAPVGRREGHDWLGPPFGESTFVQFIALDMADRPREAIAKAWIHELVTAIRQADPKHMITVGMVDWSLIRPRHLYSGFAPDKVAGELDFIAVHVYPESGKTDDAAETLKGFFIGKPVVVEETFPLSCPPAELERFIDGPGKDAAGWIGFYWGPLGDESEGIVRGLMKEWLEMFERHAKTLK